MEAKTQVQVFQSKKNALKFLRDGDTNLFTKALTGDKSELLEQMGIDNSKYDVAELKRMLDYADIAKRSADKLPTGEGEIKKLIFFSPPHFQDKDCAVMVSEREISDEEKELILAIPDSGFRLHLEIVEACLPKIWLLVYEAP